MRLFRIILALAAVLGATVFLAGCSGEPGLDRVDVEWATDPPPRWGLYPGYRQMIPFKKGSAYHVHVYTGDTDFTGGTVADTGYSLAFRPTAGAKDIEAESLERYKLNIYVTMKNEKGEARRLLCLKVERQDDKIYFEFPKQ
ncbi:MAG: hypothetical protein C0405_10330 [Desulfovibrio sp.]|nr:hypothetical protein [Desulfovibrio sp.]